MAAQLLEQRVFTDTLSGSAKTAHPGLAEMLDYARPGDTVVVAAIDRLGRSVAEVTRTIADLGEQPNYIARLARRRRHSHTNRARRGSHHGHPGPNSSSSWAASAGQPPANRVDPGACRPPSRRS